MIAAPKPWRRSPVIAVWLIVGLVASTILVLALSLGPLHWRGSFIIIPITFITIYAVGGMIVPMLGARRLNDTLSDYEDGSAELVAVPVRIRSLSSAAQVAYPALLAGRRGWIPLVIHSNGVTVAATHLPITALAEITRNSGTVALRLPGDPATASIELGYLVRSAVTINALDVAVDALTDHVTPVDER
jgi:hypothetical protein